jgi:hypothetical protein
MLYAYSKCSMPLTFLCLGYKIIRILIVFLMRLQDALCVFKVLYVHSKYSRSNISINPLFSLANAKERWILLADSQIDTISFLFNHCIKAPSVLLYMHQNVPGVTPCSFKILQELLYLYYEGRVKIYVQKLVLNISVHGDRELRFPHL